MPADTRQSGSHLRINDMNISVQPRQFLSGHLIRRSGNVTQPLGRIGPLCARLAASRSDIAQAQSLRYRVFCKEMGAPAGAIQKLTRRDRDHWDRVCDHLLVFDEAQEDVAARRKPVGTYRFLTQQNAARRGCGFYTQGEFDIAPLMARHPTQHFMELGRSCVLPKWRDKRTIELLWHGTWAYVLRNKVDVMIGCASFSGTDPQALAEPLSFLFHHCAPDPGWGVEARQGRGVGMNLMAAEELDPKRALRSLPPLIKGYLRLGAMIAGEAVVDHQFGTTDVLVILPVSRINPRYVQHYGADAGRHAG
mgnify:CR=1 FL=1